MSYSFSPDKCYYMFHKPTGCITARSDPRHATIMDYIDSDRPGLHPMGRLDKDTTGLLLLTDDGKFNDYLMSPKNHVPKTYEFCALGDLTFEYQKELMQGIYLKGDPKITAPCKITVTGHSVLTDIIPLITDTHYRSLLKNRPDHPVTFGRITITEGRKHHVKRLLKYAHCCVVSLKRISIGELALDPDLAPGTYRPLTPKEMSLF